MPLNSHRLSGVPFGQSATEWSGFWSVVIPANQKQSWNVMTRNTRWTFGSLWVDNVLPVVIGASCAPVVIREAGPFWTLLLVPALCWCVWQLVRRLGARLGVRVLLVTSLAVAILGYMFLFFGVDTTKLYQTVADAGIGVNTVSSDRHAVVVSIQPVSWGPERNVALRTIFAAAHTHAKSKKLVRIQWGDAMTTTVKMNDIEAFIAGEITYREMLNRMDWSGTPDILPDESTTRHGPWLISKVPSERGTR